jgi:hypothetical protein
MKTDKPEILTALKKLLSKYSKSMKVTKDNDKAYELYCTKKVNMFNKEIDGLYFASAVIQGGFVGLYFLPIYTNPKNFAELPAELRKCLKGKSCFHIKKLDKGLELQIKEMLKQGYDLYKKAGIA